MYVSTSQNKSNGIVVLFYHVVHSLDWFKCLQKKKDSVSVFVCNGKAEAKKIVLLGLR